MRIWSGLDVEHNPSYGRLTLFVESKNPNIDKILDILSTSNLRISCIYFGAGEVDIECWEFLESLHKLSALFLVGIETSTFLPKSIVDKFNFVVVRVPVAEFSDKVYIKYRANDSVGLSPLYRFDPTSLVTLKDGKYKGDIEIYRDKEA